MRKLSIVASAMVAMFGRNEDKSYSVFEHLQHIADKAKPKGQRSSTPSAHSYAMMRKQNELNSKHSLRCQFRIKGNEIMANGKHRLYIKNGEIVDRLEQK